jgi:hypothetical protein
MKFALKLMIRCIFLLLVQFALILPMMAEDIMHIKAPLEGFATRQHRTEFAKQLKGFFEALDKKIPTVKPTERDYVEKELKRLRTRGKPPIDLNESLRWQREADDFFTSREYRSWRVKDGIESLIRSLDTLIKKDGSLESEFYEWAEFSCEVLDSDIFEHVADLNQETRWTERNIVIGTHSSFTAGTPSSGCKSAIAAAISDYIFKAHFRKKQ